MELAQERWDAERALAEAEKAKAEAEKAKEEAEREAERQQILLKAETESK